jgi:outer membrane protein TolC
VTTKIRDTGQAVNVARERFLLASQEVEMARKLEKAERIRFKAGTSNLFIVNLREQSTADARIREAGALETYFRARATYDYLATRFRRSPR